MLRDILIAAAVLAIAAFGLSFTDFGRRAVAIFSERGVDAREMTARLDGGGFWCFRPGETGRCAWAIGADAPRGRAFDVAVYSAERGPGGALRIAVARSGLIVSGNALCQNPARPVSPSRLGYYSDEIGEVSPTARLRLATDAEHQAYLATLADTGDAEVCFTFAEGEGGVWLQTAFVDGEPVGVPEEFVIRPPGEPALLAAP